MVFGFGKKSTGSIHKSEKLVFSLGEISLESLPLVGDKVIGVAQLAKTDVPVPPGFVISTRFYETFLLATGIKEYLSRELDLLKVKKDDHDQIRKFSQNMTDKILSAKFPDDLAYEARRAYSRLSGFSDAWVAVRTSIPTDLIHHATFVGQLHSELNVKGADQLILSIRKAFASIFSLHSIEYAISNSIDPSKLQVAVFIQKMVQAEVSGVMFTIDPITSDPNVLSVEAVYGLGDTINSGELTPDQYSIDKKTYEVKDRRVVPQEWMHVLSTEKGQLENAKVRITPAWQAKQKIEDKKLKELAEIGAYIESYLKRPQDIEWVLENGRFWILQTRNAVKLDMDLVTRVTDNLPERKMIEEIEKIAQEIAPKGDEEVEYVGVAVSSNKHQLSDATKDIYTTTPLPQVQPVQFGISTEIPKSKKKKKLLKTKTKNATRDQVENSLTLLLQGVSAGNGIVVGRANIVLYEEDAANIQPGEIVVLKGDKASWLASAKNIAAVVTDIGGITSDIAINARTLGVPCIVDTQIGTKLLRQGEVLTVDGATGKIYEGSLNMQVITPPVELKPPIVSEKLAIKTEKPAKDSKKKKKLEATPEVSLIAIEKADSPDQKLERTVIIDGQKVEIQDIKILTATKTLLDFSDKESLSNWAGQQYSIADGVGYLSGSALYQLIGKHPYAFIDDKTDKQLLDQMTEIVGNITEKVNPDMVIYSLSDLRGEDYKDLARGKTMELMLADKITLPGMRGAERHLALPKLLKLELEVIKRLRNKKGLKNLSVAVSHVRSLDQLTEIKKAISGEGLRRSKTFNIFLNPTVPANLFEMDKLLDAGIDGLIIEPKRLVAAILGVEENSLTKLSKYLKNDTVLNTLEDLFKKANKAKQRVIVRLEDEEKDFLKKILEWGASAVIVSGKNMSVVQREIRDLENELVMKRVRKK